MNKRISTWIPLVALAALTAAMPNSAEAGKTKLKKLDVATLSVELGTASLCAGQEAQLVVVAELSDGTVLRTVGADGKGGELRARDFELTADLGSVSGKEVLLVENTGLELLDRSVTVTAAGKGTSLQGSASMPVGFGCAVALDYTGDGDPGTPWVAPRSERDLAEIEAHQAATGQTGPRLKDIARAALPVGYAVDNIKNAKPALKGETGAHGAAGSTGGHGQIGAVGGPGLPGAAGHAVVVEVKEVASATGARLALVAVRPAAGGPTRTLLVDPAAGGHLTVVTRGGRGGRGGKGGNGGRGGEGTWEINEGRGGNGAAGGPGGPGGVGGPGGHVEIRYDAAAAHLATVVSADAAGGAGGRGGDGGEFGASGPGAEGASSGDMGSTESASGAPGADGAAGSVTTSPMPASALFVGLDGVGALD